MFKQFTAIELAFYPEYLNYWLRFGMPYQRLILDKGRSLALFKPGSAFGYVRWVANEYGTQGWRFVVGITGTKAQNLSPVERFIPVEGIHPSCIVLLITVGTTRVKRALAQIESLEKAGFNPCKISRSYYRHLHNRLMVGLPVRPYCMDQHVAHLAAQRVAI